MVFYLIKLRLNVRVRNVVCAGLWENSLHLLRSMCNALMLISQLTKQVHTYSKTAKRWTWNLLRHKPSYTKTQVTSTQAQIGVTPPLNAVTLPHQRLQYPTVTNSSSCTKSHSSTPSYSQTAAQRRLGSVPPLFFNTLLSYERHNAALFLPLLPYVTTKFTKICTLKNLTLHQT